MSQDIAESVKRVIAETIGVDESAIDMEKRIEDICEDSIQIFTLVMNFEKKFKYSVTYDELMRIETIRDVVNLLSRLRKEGKI